VPASDDLDTATDDFLGAPDRGLANEVRFVTQRRELPTWTTPLVGTDLPARRLVAQAIRDNASAFVVPHWPRIRSYLNTETAAAARRFMTDGLRGMMTGLHPAISWDPPWLTVGRGSNGRAHVMAGQGIAFVPSVFMDGEPIVFTPHDANDPWLVIYPAVKDIADLARLHGDPRGPHAVAKLIGHSRSDLLNMIAEQPGLSVKDLATLIGISLGAASEHITVMRSAGLIAGRRQGKAHRHSLTPLGASLLHADGQAGGGGAAVDGA
jgi:DNA-binding transcriptional ArsR family regulator